jgi:O-antigen/teichoic acid export membrane protein
VTSASTEEPSTEEATIAVPEDGPREPKGRSPFGEMFRSAGFYALFTIVSRSASLLLLPIYTRLLSPREYGILELLDTVYSVVSVLVGMRLSQSLFYYYHTAKDEAERARYVTTALVGAVVLGALAASVGYTLASPISVWVFPNVEPGTEHLAAGPTLVDPANYAPLVRISFLNLATAFPAELGFGYLRVRNRARFFAAASLIRLVSNVVMNVVFLAVFGLGPAALLLSSVLNSAALAVCFAYVILSENRVSLDWGTFRRLAFYSLPLAIGAVGEMILNFGDRAFLRKAVSLGDLGIYSLAYKLGTMTHHFVAPFFIYWDAQMVRIVQRPHGEYIYARISTYFLLAVTAIVLLLTAFADPLLTVAAAPEFRGAAAYVPGIALAYLLRGMATFWSGAFLLQKRTTLVARNTWSGAIVCLLANAVLVPRFKLWGAVMALVLGFGVMAASALWRGQQVRPFRFEFDRWAKVVVSGLAAALPSLVFHPAGFWAQIGLGAACLGVFGVLLVASGFATEGERRAIANVLRRFLGGSGRERA